MDLDHYKTSYEHLGDVHYRIYVEHGGTKFSLPIQSPSPPSHEQTVQFFSQNHRHFVIEAEIITIETGEK